MRAWFLASLVAVCLCTSAAAADRSIAPIISRIPRKPVESKALATVGYSKRLRALEVEFRRGGVYRYLDVPPSVYRELQAAESKARFYNRNIKRKYRSVRVRAPHQEPGRR